MIQTPDNFNVCVPTYPVYVALVRLLAHGADPCFSGLGCVNNQQPIPQQYPVVPAVHRCMYAMLQWCDTQPIIALTRPDLTHCDGLCCCRDNISRPDLQLSKVPQRLI